MNRHSASLPARRDDAVGVTGSGKHQRLAVAVLLAALGILLVVAPAASAALPDGRGYELVSPAMKNGLAPYGAVASGSGGAVDFQARGAFAGAASGSLNLYRATRGAESWQSIPLTPAPSKPLGFLEEQVPVWFSSDLTQTIFTTPLSYAAVDEDGGALSLYKQDAHGGLTLVSQGTQGGSEPKQATFDGATPDGGHVVFSSGASLMPSATGLGLGGFPEPEYLYEREASTGQTHLLSIDSTGEPVGSVATTLIASSTPGNARIAVGRVEGFATGQFITVGEGAGAEAAQISYIIPGESSVEEIVVNNGEGLPSFFPAGTPVTHASEGAILGDGGHLASGPSPAGEYVPANSESGSTTNAISRDGSKVFFESPSPATDEPTGLYMRERNATTFRIAGAAPDGSTVTGATGNVETTFGSARFMGAASDGSLVFFTSEEGLAGATKFGTELYEFNTTTHAIGAAPAMAVHPISDGLKGDQTPATTVGPGGVANRTSAIPVSSTTGFHAGETIAFAPFETSGGKIQREEVSVIAAINSATELTTVSPVHDTGPGIPEGTELHAVHPAAMTGVSSDGSHVYFISNGVLASNSNAEGATAIPVKPNLYLYDTATDQTTFIATVAESDVKRADGNPTGLVGEPDISRPAIPTPDGNVLAFASAANLTGQNPWRQYTEIYRYAVAGNTLECLSCTAPGVKPTGNATFGETAGGTYDPPGLTSPISADGSRVFFQTPDSLVPEDQNGGAPLSAKFETPTDTDVYEGEGGKVSLISSGKATTPTVLMGTTPSGDDVLFTTTAVLAPQDTDGGYENVWDARVGGGFPATEGAGVPSCSGSTCRAAFGPAPVFAPPASTSPQPGGNVSSVSLAALPAAKPPTKPKTLTCRKGFVKKRVKGKLVCFRQKRNRSASRVARKAGDSRRRISVQLSR